MNASPPMMVALNRGKGYLYERPKPEPAEYKRLSQMTINSSVDHFALRTKQSS